MTTEQDTLKGGAGELVMALLEASETSRGQFRKQKEEAEEAVQKLYEERDALTLYKQQTLAEIGKAKGELAAAERKAKDQEAEAKNAIDTHNVQIAELHRLQAEHERHKATVDEKHAHAEAALAEAERLQVRAAKDRAEAEKVRSDYHLRVERLRKAYEG